MRLIRLAVVLILGLSLAPLAVEAQPAGKVYRIGILSPVTAASSAPFVEAFQQGLRDLGYVEGQNIVIESRWAESRPERLGEFAADLVRVEVDVIVTAGTPAIRAARQATTRIPIVMAVSGDPVGAGLVLSLARPGGNVTGLSSLAAGIVGKQLELLKQATPKTSRVAVLSNPNNAAHAAELREAEAAGRTLGVQVQRVEARGPNEFDNAFSALAREQAQALVVLADVNFPPKIADLVTARRLPAVYPSEEYTKTGGLIAYGASRRELYRRAAYFVDRILKGSKPSDLPVEQPTKFELVFNLKTAKALGLTIPQTLLLRADQIIG